MRLIPAQPLRRAALSIVTSMTVLLAGFAMPSLLSLDAAEASPNSPSIVVRESGMTLTGTTVAGFENSAHVKVTFTVSTGLLNFDPAQATGVTYADQSQTGSTTISLVGTQANLNAAFSKVFVTACGSNLNMSATVMDSDQLAMFAENGHAYKWVKAGSNINWHVAHDAAAAMTFDSSVGSQHGYLVTITSQAESDFVTNLVLGQRLAAWMGASDSATEINLVAPGTFASQSQSEGHWSWVTGPEAGTRFYEASTRTVVSGAFANWYTNPSFPNPPQSEPNNDRSREHVGMFRSDATWNDKWENEGGQIDSYVVEFGGMPGNPLPTPLSTSSTYARPFVDPCAARDPIVTVNVGAGGLAPISEYSDPNGDHKVIEVAPLNGFALRAFVVDGVPTSLSGNQYTLSNVMVDHTVDVSFVALPGVPQAASTLAHSGVERNQGVSLLVLGTSAALLGTFLMASSKRRKSKL